MKKLCLIVCIGLAMASCTTNKTRHFSGLFANFGEAIYGETLDSMRERELSDSIREAALSRSIALRDSLESELSREFAGANYLSENN